MFLLEVLLIKRWDKGKEKKTLLLWPSQELKHGFNLFPKWNGRPVGSGFTGRSLVFTLTDWQTGRNDRQEVKTEYRKKRRSSSSRKRRRRRHLQRLFLSFSCSFSTEEMLVCSQLQHPCRHCLLVTSSFLFINAGWSPFYSEKKTYWSCSKPHFKASQGGCETVLTRDLIKMSVFGRKWRYSRWEEGPDLKEWNLSVRTNEFRPVAEELIRRDSIQKTEEEEPLTLCLVGCHVSFGFSLHPPLSVRMQDFFVLVT